jgi:hypothetical protein
MFKFSISQKLWRIVQIIVISNIILSVFMRYEYFLLFFINIILYYYLNLVITKYKLIIFKLFVNIF